MGGVKGRGGVEHVQIPTEYERPKGQDQKMEQGGIWQHLLRQKNVGKAPSGNPDDRDK